MTRNHLTIDELAPGIIRISGIATLGVRSAAGTVIVPPPDVIIPLDLPNGIDSGTLLAIVAARLPDGQAKALLAAAMLAMTDGTQPEKPKRPRRASPPTAAEERCTTSATP